MELDGLEPFASEMVTVSTASIGLTAATYNPTNNPPGAIAAFLSTDADTLRFRVDGGTPTSSVGHQMAAGSSLVLPAGQFLKFRAIRSGSADVPLAVTYYRMPR